MSDKKIFGQLFVNTEGSSDAVIEMEVKDTGDIFLRTEQHPDRSGTGQAGDALVLQPDGSLDYGKTSSNLVEDDFSAFAIGDQVYYNGGSWAKVDLGNFATLPNDVFYTVISASATGAAARYGRVDVPSHGFTVDQTYYIDNAVVGGVIATAPSNAGEYSYPAFHVIDANTLEILNDERGIEIADSGESSKFIVKLGDTNYRFPISGNLTTEATGLRFTGLTVGKKYEIDVVANFDVSGGTNGSLSFFALDVINGSSHPGSSAAANYITSTDFNPHGSFTDWGVTATTSRSFTAVDTEIRFYLISSSATLPDVYLVGNGTAKSQTKVTLTQLEDTIEVTSF